EPLGYFFAAPGSMTECMFAFLATDLRQDALPADEDERIDVTRIPFHELVRMARTGEVHDAKTLASLLLAQPHVCSS
ncbi:MAG: NUDIX hydrolase, partial [Dehalococcoidia bacterium]